MSAAQKEFGFIFKNGLKKIVGKIFYKEHCISLNK